MATLVISALGASIGAGIGGSFLGMSAASIGWTLGGIAASFLQGGPNTQGPRREDLSATSSARGAHIRKDYGAMRGAGNLIWSSGIKEQSTSKSSGKGGGGGSHTEYTYSASFAISHGKGTIVGISRIWGDGKLIYDKLDSSSGVSSEISDDLPVSMYPGNEYQEPDPVIQAAEGAHNTPAFRGITYSVFEDLPLGTYGNRIANFTFEAVENGENIYSYDSIEFPNKLTTGDKGSIQTVVGNDLYVLDTDSVGMTYQPKRYDLNGNILWTGLTMIAPSGVLHIGAIRYSSTYQWAYNDKDSSNNRRVHIQDIDGGDIYLYSPGGTAAGWVGRDVVLEPTNSMYYVTWTDNAETGYITEYLNTGGTHTNNTSFANRGQGLNPSLFSNKKGKLLSATTLNSQTYQYDILTKSIDGFYSFGQVAYMYNAWNTWFGRHGADAYGDHIFLHSSVSSNENKLHVIKLHSDLTHSLVHEVIIDDTWFSYTATYANAENSVWNNLIRVLGGRKINPIATEVSDVIGDICTMSGLNTSDIETSSITEKIYGYSLSSRMNGRAAIDPLLSAYDISASESDYKIKFKNRTSVIDVIIPEECLGAVNEGGNAPKLSLTIMPDDELPRRVEVSYTDVKGDYQTGNQFAQRNKSIVSSVGEVSVDFPIAYIDGNEPAKTAELLLYRSWIEGYKYKLHIPFRYVGLDSGDLIQTTYNGNTHTIRINSIDTTLYQLLEISGVADRPSRLISDAVGGEASYKDQALNLIGGTVIELMDIPALKDADTGNPGYYVAAYGVATGWTGSVIYKSSDAEVSWINASTITIESSMGVASTSLPDHSYASWDMDSSVNVILQHGTLSSDTEINVLNGANVALLGDEIIQWMFADLEETDGSYTLRTLLRGRKGTEHAISSHSIGDRFVVLDLATTGRMQAAYSQIGSEYSYKAASNGQYLQDVTTIKKMTLSNAGAKPWSVVKVRGIRNGTNDLTISWIRRSRITATPLWTPALCEEEELYEIHIMAGAPIVRIIQASTNSVIYSSSQQTIDGITPGDPIEIKIYQISATVGRGFPAGEIL